MTIHEQRHGAVTVLAPNGALNGDDAVQFRERAVRVFTESLGRFVIDAGKIPFVDSQGLESLADLSEHLAQSGQTLKLCAVNDTLREVFELTETTAFFEHYDDVNSAVRSFR